MRKIFRFSAAGLAASLTAGLLSVFSAGQARAQNPSLPPSQQVSKPIVSEENPSSAVLTQEYCSACHSFQLVAAQRLDRATWEWVMDDMVEEFGAGWITAQEQRKIIDYLVKHYGPQPLGSKPE